MSKSLSEGKKRKKTGTGNLIFILVSAAVVLIDQLAKWFVRQNFLFTRNTGAAFGIFRGNATSLAWLSLIIIILILFLYSQLPDSRLVRIAVALMLGGVVGNLIDRVFLGYVTDFISIWIWPSFNLADSATTIGVLLLLFWSIRKK